MLMQKYSTIGLPIKNGFPEIYHTFSNHTLTAQVGRTGGIDRLAFIDVRYVDDMMFPNRWYADIFNRKNWHLERPMYGPAIKFISVSGNGSSFHHAPVSGRKLPYGVISEQRDELFGNNSYNIFLDREQTLHVMTGVEAGKFDFFDIVISKYHIADGKYMINQNQHLGRANEIEILSGRKPDEDYLNKKPFDNIQGEMKWTDFVFDEKSNVFICSAVRIFEDGTERPLYVLFGCSQKCTVIETEQNWILRVEYGSTDKIAAAAAIGEDIGELKKKVSLSYDDTQKKLERMLAETEITEKSSSVFFIENMPEVSDFARIALSMQKSVVIDDETDYAAILAGSGKYGFFMSWDHVYPIRDFITNGDFETAKKLLRYGIDYPHGQTSVFSAEHLILEIAELTAFEGNTEFLQEVYGKIKDCFEHLKKYSDADTGIMKTDYGCGADNPAEIGLAKFFHASCYDAWYYAATRTMADFALMLNDDTSAEEYFLQSEKHKENYMKYFFDEQVGALRVGVNYDLSSASVNVFHNSSSIGLDYPYGEFLLRKGVHRIAEYYKTKLRHPTGYSALAYDSESPCEMWRSVYMTQHLGHNTRVQRLNNDMVEANRVADHYFKEFAKSLNAIETFNIDGLNGDTSQRASWQTFSCTAALHCIHQTLAGVAWSMGGLYYLPADDYRDVKVENFIFDGRKWKISINGSGSFVKKMKLNGKTFVNTMQVPVDMLESAVCELEIIRSAEVPDVPVLLYAEDIRIKEFETAECGISFKADGKAFGVMKFFAEKEAVVTVNGSKIPTEYFADTKILWCNCKINYNDKIECFYPER
ncbi:MAG: hypothetical protein IKB71_06615 [Lentisphaeria bacterium]|nr:hypothetical protein [Lentisphaeria bacterium]